MISRTKKRIKKKIILINFEGLIGVQNLFCCPIFVAKFILLLFVFDQLMIGCNAD